MGRPRATHTNQLPGHAPSEHWDDSEHDNAGSADATSDPGHVRDAPRAGRGGANRERVCGNAPGRIASSVPSR